MRKSIVLSLPFSLVYPDHPITHRYRKSKIDCLRFVTRPLLAPAFQGFFFIFLWWPLTVLRKQTRHAVRAFKQSIILRCLCYHPMVQNQLPPEQLGVGHLLFLQVLEYSDLHFKIYPTTENPTCTLSIVSIDSLCSSY